MSGRGKQFKPKFEYASTAVAASLIVGALGGPMFMWSSRSTPSRAPASHRFVAVAPGTSWNAADATTTAPDPGAPSDRGGHAVAPATAGALGAHPRRSTASSSPAARGAQPTSGGEGEAPLAGIIQAPTAYDGATDELALGHNSEQVLSAIKRSRESMSAAERAQWIDQAAQFGDRRAELEPMLLSELRAKGASEAPAAAEGDAPGAEAAAPGVGTSSGGNGSDRYLLQAHAHQSLMSLMDDPERAMSVTSEAMAENGDSPVLVDLVYRQFLRKFPAKEAELKGKLSSSGFDAESTDKLVSGNL